jgi:hypothetical protein
MLTCCCCGKATRGRQWWNRDTGYGLCVECIPLCAKDVKLGEKTSSYGIRGVHFDIPTGERTPMEPAPALNVICQWCKTLIGYRPCVWEQNGKETHGGCRACWKIHGNGPATPEMELEWDRLEAILKARKR